MPYIDSGNALLLFEYIIYPIILQNSSLSYNRQNVKLILKHSHKTKYYWINNSICNTNK